MRRCASDEEMCIFGHGIFKIDIDPITKEVKTSLMRSTTITQHFVPKPPKREPWMARIRPQAAMG